MQKLSVWPYDYCSAQWQAAKEYDLLLLSCQTLDEFLASLDIEDPTGAALSHSPCSFIARDLLGLYVLS